MSSNIVLTGGVSYNNLEHQCAWRMYITAGNETVEVGYPLSCQFNIVRNVQASTNSASFTIYNLSPKTRESKFFFQDRFNTSEVKTVVFEAGYNGNFTRIFHGDISEAYSWRNGVDMETHIEAIDEGIVGNFLAITFEAGTTKKEAYKRVVSESGLKLGAIGTLEGEFKQPVTFTGAPLDILNKITGGHTFIDNTVVHTLQNNEALEYAIDVLDADTGLLGTPRRRGAEVVVESVFNPNFVVGQALDIKSETANLFSRTYKVWGITHSGMISATVAGKRTTTLNLFIDDYIPNSNYNVTGVTQDSPFSIVKQENVTPYNGTYGTAISEVYRYIQNHNGNISGLGKINRRISWQEMLGQNTAYDLKHECTEAILYNCQQIANALLDFCDTNFSGRPIIINSGWRSRAKNAKTDGAVDNSQHIYGKAIDFTIQGVDIPTLHSKFRYGWQYALGTYSWGCHVDLRKGVRF